MGRSIIAAAMRVVAIRRSIWAVRMLGRLIASLAAIQMAQSSGASVPPSDVDIRKILAERVDALGGEEGGVAIIVGTIGPQGRKLIAYGHLNQQDSQPLDGDSVFEIGSVTKTFTALLLADMVRKRDVSLTDPVAKYLPAEVKLPEWNGRPITLRDLATHTSGLPFMPDELPASNDPAAVKYSSRDLYQYLAGYMLSRDIGSKWEYSNTGYWLLSQALAARAGTDYENLLRTRVIARLKLESTAFTLSPTMKAKLAVGHNAVLQPLPPGSTIPIYAIMPAAGGLYSTTNDLLTLLSVLMGYERSELAPAMALTISTRHPISRLGFAQALGWTVIQEDGDQLIVHDGGTLGYASSVAWDPTKRVGIVVLSNQVANVGDIARHLLRPTVPLEKPTATKRIEVALDPAILDSYVGRYEAQEEGVFNVVREGAFLTIQPPASWGLPKLQLHPENQRDFFAAELPLRATFQSDSDGRVNGMLIHPPRGQRPIPANRISPNR